MKTVNQNVLKSKIVLSLIDKGVFSEKSNPRVTKFQGGFYHIKSDNDSGKVELNGNTIKYDMVKFGNGEAVLIEQRNSDNSEVKEIIQKFKIDTNKMVSSIFVYDRAADEIKEFKMHKTFDKMNNGIKAMQIQRIKFAIKADDLILNTNLDRYIR